MGRSWPEGTLADPEEVAPVMNGQLEGLSTANPEMNSLLEWLRQRMAGWGPEAVGMLIRTARANRPLQTKDFEDLLRQLDEADALVPLPTEPAALANVVEQALLSFLHERLEELASGGKDVAHASAGDRAYPDLEVSGTFFSESGDTEFHAVDVKVARRRQRAAGEPTATQSRVTLYTGNTYFKYPKLLWPGLLRPFGSYASHLCILVLYDFLPEGGEHVANVEVLVHPTWRIASKQRSSRTREYIGGVTSLEDLREGRGEFSSESDFYRYWHGYEFKQSAKVTQILYKLLEKQS